MIKKAYEKPEMEDMEAGMKEQILSSSISVTTKGLDEEEKINYDDKNSGSVWDDAW